ncbi:hypothetical protein EVAR_33318_1 [Eumeta japonica]|uniref:Uncharacterized protein n=1 Tax=Eumeta variegata TaxID=151549 RepID=A0A4C1WHT9_EUMVA|nr:hypothetical protein EVAR_33318_1 [Eumeta japonica]
MDSFDFGLPGPRVPAAGALNRYHLSNTDPLIHLRSYGSVVRAHSSDEHTVNSHTSPRMRRREASKGLVRRRCRRSSAANNGRQ